MLGGHVWGRRQRFWLSGTSERISFSTCRMIHDAAGQVNKGPVLRRRGVLFVVEFRSVLDIRSILKWTESRSKAKKKQRRHSSQHGEVSTIQCNPFTTLKPTKHLLTLIPLDQSTQQQSTSPSPSSCSPTASTSYTTSTPTSQHS